MTLRRSQDDLDQRPCIVQFSPYVDVFTETGLDLAEHKATSGVDVDKIQVDHSGLMRLAEDVGVITVNDTAQFLWELFPRGHVTLLTTLPKQYYEAVTTGHRYKLIWSGKRTFKWDWGTIQSHVGCELRPPTQDGEPQSLVIAGTEPLSFSVEKKEKPWPDRAAYEAKAGFVLANTAEEKWRRQQSLHEAESPEPMRPSERDPAAPLLRVELESPPTTTLDSSFFEVTIKVIHERLSESDVREEANGPVIFHKYPFEAYDRLQEGVHLYRRQLVNGTVSWETYANDDDDETGYRVHDAPNVSVTVGINENFISLQPGESWTTSHRLQGPSWSKLPQDAEVGDVIKCLFKGAVVDWWDWGSCDDHAGTTVELPCWIFGRVLSPADNNGRARLIAPASNTVEFTIVE